MRVREGLIPTVLGTAVTATGMVVKRSRPILGWGITGFGIAHVILGALDLREHR